MKKLKIFLWFFISNIYLFAASISSVSIDKDTYLIGDTVDIHYSIDDNYRYKVKFTAIGADNKILAPNFSATALGETFYVIPYTYIFDNLTIRLELIDKNTQKILDTKDINVNIDNFSTIQLSRVFDLGFGTRSIQVYDKRLPNTDYNISFEVGDVNLTNNSFSLSDSCGHSISIASNIRDGNYSYLVNLTDFCDLYFNINSNLDDERVDNLKIKIVNQ